MKTTSLIALFFSLLLCLSAPSFSQPDSITIYLPKLVNPPDEEGQGWSRPKVWGIYDIFAENDAITIPNGRPIYALIVSGYAQNSHFDQLLVYKFAKYLMEQGAYVHYAWWNNLLAPYMERPLHYDQSHPGNLGQNFASFTTAALAQYKAIPGEDYQFVEDAKRLLGAIRQHNPNAIIIVVGHSMGGGAVVHLASPWNTNEQIDILAPIDPVGNRNFPWSTLRASQSDYNWTRWRVTRDKFLGYKRLKNNRILPPPECVPDWQSPWRKDYAVAKNLSALLCRNVAPYIHPAPALTFGNNVVHLYHRYQKEFLFPFDYNEDYNFGHNPPQGGSTDQAVISMQSGGSDLWGWPDGNDPSERGCCPSDTIGVGWPFDGHGEIVGHRGPITGGGPVPLGVRVQTSPDCGNIQCIPQVWPWRHKNILGNWVDPDANFRRILLENLENLPNGSTWDHRPYNPELCLVSDGLIELFNGIVTSVQVNSVIPTEFSLEQNYPNPFNPSTKIKHSVLQNGFVKLSVYNLVGEEVAVLVNDVMDAGFYEVTFNAVNLPSGTYFYKLESAGSVQVKKMLLLK